MVIRTYATDVEIISFTQERVNALTFHDHIFTNQDVIQTVWYVHCSRVHEKGDRSPSLQEMCYAIFSRLQGLSLHHVA